MTELSPMTQLAILLTARWAVNGTGPLSNSEFLKFRKWLGADDESASTFLLGKRSLQGCPIDPLRIEALLKRGLGVFHFIDRWIQAGLWVRSWRDAGYPSRFRELKLRAPALLFGYGNPEAFTERALAIVGSRNASPERLELTDAIARKCAAESITVVSGGARGVDSIAMSAGIVAGGTVVGVLSDSLLKESGKREYREAIVDARLCLMSEVHPEAGFDVRTAMARNRLAYASADAALIIECEPRRGGTWQGAMEARREGKAIYVLRGARAERELADLGATIIEHDFALQPSKLIQGIRPETSPKSAPSLIVWFRDLMNSTQHDATKLESLLRTQSAGIARELIRISEREGVNTSRSEPLTDQDSTGPKQNEPSRKRRRDPSKELLLFDNLESTVKE